MVESTEPSESDDSPAFGRLDGASGRSIGRERHVRSVLVVVLHVLTNASEQVALADHDQVIGELAPECSDELSVVFRCAFSITLG